MTHLHFKGRFQIFLYLNFISSKNNFKFKLMGPNVKFDFIKCNTKVNVWLILTAVDWESVASNFFYFTPAMQTKDVGRYVSELIHYLCTDRGTDLKLIHIIG